MNGTRSESAARSGLIDQNCLLPPYTRPAPGVSPEAKIPQRYLRIA